MADDPTQKKKARSARETSPGNAAQGWAADILTRVINVHWADQGLAVEFFAGDK